ncbi:MAG TPA: TonB-dependent receptor plug domain-containing protein, partial [Candidatus Elarobacter sp.]|nr:TonB-dependent receptor plug domain-containing protein [Candidatus Elarobacter sp.]
GRTQIEDQGSPQLARDFDEVPGVISNHTASSNPASPGAQTSPNLRGALDYEKTTLIDGHPVATGRFGDYVTTFLSAYVLQSVEIAKGPGAFAPLVVNGIGGSVNFRTRDPYARPTTAFDLVSDGYGGSLVHALASTTIGKLGLLVDAVSYGTPGAFHALPSTVALPSGTQIAGVGTIGATASTTPPAGTRAGAFPIANAQNNPANAYVGMTACCQSVDSSFLGRSEVVKARWRFSDTTTLTAGYVGNQSAFDLDGAQLQSLNAIFSPSGTPVALNPATHLPSNVTELENEPLFEAELRTALRDDTVIARWYSVSLNRFTANAAISPAQPFTGIVNLTGSAPLSGGGTTPTFANTPETITIPDVYSRTVEEDRVRGGSFAWIHPAGPNDYELAVDRIVSLTNAYSVGASGGSAVFSASVPAGSSQTITSVLARGTLRPTEYDALTLAAYATTYRNHFSTGPLPLCHPELVEGCWAFGDATHGEIDPRLGFTHRLRRGDAVVRFSMGGAVTPPAFNVLSGVNQTPASVFRPGATSLTVTRNAGTLLPETSFGYDLGADVRVARDTVASFDAYLTNVRNQLVTTVAPAGTFAPPGGGAPIPVYASAAGNAGDSRFEGIEAALRSDPRAGFGYVVQGALQRAFAYAVSPSLYANASGAFGTNLAIVPNANYTSTGTGFNGISNKAIPYAQGYAEAHYRTERGGLLLLGMTYYGNNNSYGVPAFGVANASLRVPIASARDHAALQLSVDNLFDVQGGQTIATDAGIPVPLANGKVGLVNALPVGPRAVRIELHAGGAR